MSNIPQVRRNACSWPLSRHQLFMWVLLVACSLLFCTSVIPLYPQTVRPNLLYISIILCTVLLTVCLATSLIDPADPIWLKSYNDELRSLWRAFAISHKESELLINGHQLRYCYSCSVYVHASSFHCSFCMKCIHNFDHHCFWINNCVGSRNYGWFIASTLLACLTNFFMFLTSLLIVVDSFTTRIYDSPLFGHRNSSYWNSSNWSTTNPIISTNSTPGDFSIESLSPSYQVLFVKCNIETWLSTVIINLLIFALASILLFMVTFFHLYLKMKQLSTLQYLRRRRRKRRSLNVNPL